MLALTSEIVEKKRCGYDRGGFLGRRKSPEIGLGCEARPGCSPWTPYLEVEDASISILEALPVRDHAVEDVLIQGEGCNGS